MVKNYYTSWGRSIKMKERLALAGELKVSSDGSRYYQGRRIIGRDSPVNHGVYLGANPREAIVVDYDKYPG